MRIHRRSFLALAGATSVSSLIPSEFASRSASAATEDAIELIVPAGAASRTGIAGQLVAAALERELGRPVKVINIQQPGQGYEMLAAAPPDGRTFGLVAADLVSLNTGGTSAIGPGNVTPLGLLNEDPAGIHVRKDAPWRRASAVIDAAQSNGGTLKASGAGRKAIWHVSVERWAMASGLGAENVDWESARNASVAAQNLVVGGTDVVVCSVPEIRMAPSVASIKTLAIMGRSRHPRYPGIPTLKEQGLALRAGLWRGVAAPPGLPAPIARKMTAALRNIASASTFKRPMLRRGFGLAFADGSEFADYMAEEQADYEVAMAAIGTGPYEGPKMRRPSSPPDVSNTGEAPPRQSYGAAPS